MDLMSSKPGRGSAQGFSTEGMVSPTFVSATFLMVATKKPTSPAVSSAISTGLGVMTPMGSTSKRRALDKTLIFLPLRGFALTVPGGPIAALYGSEHVSQMRGWGAA